MDEQGQLPNADCDRPHAEVVKDFGGRLRPDGPDGEINEWSIYDESFRRLVAWGEEQGLFYQGLQPLKEGGREHDLTFDQTTGTWLKFTKASKAGYVVGFETGVPALEPGLPLEYLGRLSLQNEGFGDAVVFVGIGGDRYQPRIITRQPDVPGEDASYDDIRRMMTECLGFDALAEEFLLGYADSLAFIREDIAVFDLRPANVVRTAEGLIVPIDCIPVRLRAAARLILGK